MLRWIAWLEKRFQDERSSQFRTALCYTVPASKGALRHGREETADLREPHATGPALPLRGIADLRRRRHRGHRSLHLAAQPAHGCILRTLGGRGNRRLEDSPLLVEGAGSRHSPGRAVALEFAFVRAVALPHSRVDRKPACRAALRLRCRGT